MEGVITNITLLDNPVIHIPRPLARTDNPDIAYTGSVVQLIDYDHAILQSRQTPLSIVHMNLLSSNISCQPTCLHLGVKDCIIYT